MRRFGPWLCWLLLCLLPHLAKGHTRSYSHSQWRWHGEIGEVTFRLEDTNLAELEVGSGLEGGSIGPRELQRMRASASEQVRRGVSVSQGGQSCRFLVPQEPARIVANMVVVSATVHCPKAAAEAGFRLKVQLFPELGMGHTHIARVEVGDRRTSAALNTSRPFLDWGGSGEASPDSFLRVVGGFITIGIVHILTGYDHIAFLLTLLLVVWQGSTTRGSFFRDLLLAASAFTIGHSATLALAVTGLIQPRSATVELLIALSIAVVALEGFALARPEALGPRLAPWALWLAPIAASLGLTQHSAVVLMGLCVFSVAYLAWIRRAPRSALLRGAVAGIFGLVHGFGFAGVLTSSGFSTHGAQLALALLGFNLGVELGQAAVLIVCAAALWRVHASPHRRPVIEWGSTCSFALACLWVGLRGL